MEEFIPIATITLAVTALFFIGVFVMLYRFKIMLRREHEARETDNNELKQQISAVNKLFTEIKETLNK